ncbi:MAG TPA: sugar nucleotide-binding protein [Chryseosolibacter sp.]|nr:sugar nucleotide-binding protein [Chryseosolibacter sp.]
MTDNNGFLVVGGDSLVGAGLFRSLERFGKKAITTTRRRDTLSDKRVYLDFESEDTFFPPMGVDYAFIVAAATNYDRCEKDPLAQRINVELIPKLIASLLEHGIFVTFISTNSVFGGERPWPHEEDTHAPGIAYARQKAEAEKAIRAAAHRLKAEERLSVVRLTKILDLETPPLPSWLAAWKRGETVQPFSDLIFAPISVRFVGDSLATIGEKRVPGDFHLSGAENVTYVDLAFNLAEKLGVDTRLIAPTTAEKKGVHIPFKPRYSGLGMQRTTELCGVKPQSLADVVSDLIAENNI